jgi:predicted nucleic acid-binding protein
MQAYPRKNSWRPWMKNASATTRNAMSRVNLFLDSRVLFSGIVSASSAARALLLLAETDHIVVTISEQVVTETERALARKASQALSDLQRAILASKARIVRDPPPEDVSAHLNLISHPADVPILLVAMHTRVDYLVTLKRRHFLDDPGVAQKTDLRIGTPAEALGRVREQISTQEGG